ncbi:hypothetical protein [Faecalicatena contorta]|nr:hypothetical protein [Faecalicatena contorta]
MDAKATALRSESLESQTLYFNKEAGTGFSWNNLGRIIHTTVVNKMTTKKCGRKGRDYEKKKCLELL